MHFEVEKVRFALKKKTGVHCPGCSLAHPSRTTRGGGLGWNSPIIPSPLETCLEADNRQSRRRPKGRTDT